MGNEYAQRQEQEQQQRSPQSEYAQPPTTPEAAARAKLQRAGSYAEGREIVAPPDDPSKPAAPKEQGPQTETEKKSSFKKEDGKIEGSFDAKQTTKDDVSSTEKSVKASIGGEDGPEAEVARKRTLQVEGDKDNAQSTQDKLAYKKGTATATRTHDAKWKDEEGVGHKEGSSGYVSADQEGKTVVGGSKTTGEKHGDDSSERTLGAHVGQKDGDLQGGVSGSQTKGDDVHKVQKGANIGVGDKGFEADVSRKKTLQVEGDEDNAQSSSQSLSYKDGKAKAAIGSDAQWKDEEGTKHKSSSSTSVGVDKDGNVSAGHDRSSSTVDAAGNSNEKKIGVGFDAGKGEATLKGSSVHKDAEGEVKKGVSGSATIGKDKVAGEVALTRGKETVSASAGITVKCKPPVLDKATGLWSIDYTREMKAGAGLGTKKGKVGVGVTGAATKVDAGVQKFSSKEEAEDFARNAAFRIGALEDKASTAEGAATMKEGEEISVATGKKAGFDANVTVEGVEVGGGADVAHTSSRSVKKVGKDLLEVRVGKGDIDGYHGSVGAAGIKMKGAKKHSESEELTVRFDLSKSEGKAAYDAFMKTGRVPKEGAKIMEESRGHEDESSSGVEALGASAEVTHTTSEKVTHKDGHKTEQYEGKEGVGVSIPLLGHLNADTSLAVEEEDDKKRTYKQTTHVEATDGADAAMQLAEATGTHGSVYNVGKSSGKWAVTSYFTESQVKTLVEKLLGGHANVSALTVLGTGPADRLTGAIRQAGGNTDDWWRALSGFIAETGTKGIAVIRDITGAEPKYDVGLEGDPNFPGESGRRAMEAKVRELTLAVAKPGADGPGLARTIQGDIAALEQRLAAISEPMRYKDLPIELRQQEMHKVQGFVQALTGLRDQAVGLVQPKAEAKTEAQQPAPAKKGKHSKAESAAPAPAPVDPQALQLSAKQAALATADPTFGRFKAKATAALQVVRKSRWVHNGAYCFSDSARSKFGETHWYGDGADVGDYVAADDSFNKGFAFLSLARALDQRLEKTRLEYALAVAEPDKALKLIDALLTMLQATGDAYSKAAGRFTAAEEVYQGIRKKHDNSRAYFAGYDHALPEGEGE